MPFIVYTGEKRYGSYSMLEKLYLNIKLFNRESTLKGYHTIHMLCTGVTNKYLYEELFYSIFLVCNHLTRRPCWWSTIEFFSRTIYMKIEVSSQRREMLFFLTTNIAAVKSRANQHLEEPIVTLATIVLRGRCQKGSEKWEKGFRAGAGIEIRNRHVRT